MVGSSVCVYQNTNGKLEKLSGTVTSFYKSKDIKWEGYSHDPDGPPYYVIHTMETKGGFSGGPLVSNDGVAGLVTGTSYHEMFCY